MITFLKINNFNINVSNYEAVNIVVDVAEKKISRKELARWLEKNSLPTEADTTF
jgi:prophage maintenance system killer protein